MLMELATPKGRDAIYKALKCPSRDFLIEHRRLSSIHEIVLGLSNQKSEQKSLLCGELNAIDSAGFTPLCYAAARGDKERVSQLLLCGAKLEIPKYPETSALVAACASRSSTCILPLLEAGANPNGRNACGETCLHVVAMRQNEPEAYMKPLLDHKASLNAQCDSGFTALLWATQVNSMENVKFLLDRGADANIASNEGITPLGLAILNNHHHILTLLLDRGSASVDTVTKDGESLLHLAAKSGDRQTLQLLQVAAIGLDARALNNAGQAAAEVWTQHNRDPDLSVVFFELLNQCSGLQTSFQGPKDDVSMLQ